MFKDLVTSVLLIIFLAQLGLKAEMQPMTSDQLEKGVWIVTCATSLCQEAFEFTLDRRCNGKRQCGALIREYYPTCKNCVEELFEPESFIEIEESEYLLCDHEDRVQELGCQYYCRANFLEQGSCQRHETSLVPICSCKLPTTPASKFGTLVETLTDDLALYTKIIALSDGSIMFQSSRDYSLQIWDVESGMLLKKLTLENPKSLSDAAFLPNDLMAISAGQNIQIINLNDGTQVRLLSGHDASIHSLISIDNHLASGSLDGTVRIWNAVNGIEIWQLREDERNDGVVYALTLLPTGDIAAAYQSGLIKIWNPERGTLVKTLEGHESTVFSLVVVPNVGRLVSGTKDGKINVWNWETGLMDSSFEIHNSRISALVVLENSGYLATASDDQTISILDPINSKLVTMLDGHDDWVRSLAYLPKSGNLASGSSDGTIKIWKTSLTS